MTIGFCPISVYREVTALPSRGAPVRQYRVAYCFCTGVVDAAVCQRQLDHASRAAVLEPRRHKRLYAERRFVLAIDTNVCGRVIDHCDSRRNVPRRSRLFCHGSADTVLCLAEYS